MGCVHPDPSRYKFPRTLEMGLKLCPAKGRASPQSGENPQPRLGPAYGCPAKRNEQTPARYRHLKSVRFPIFVPRLFGKESTGHALRTFTAGSALPARLTLGSSLRARCTGGNWEPGRKPGVARGRPPRAPAPPGAPSRRGEARGRP